MPERFGDTESNTLEHKLPQTFVEMQLLQRELVRSTVRFAAKPGTLSACSQQRPRCDGCAALENEIPTSTTHTLLRQGD